MAGQPVPRHLSPARQLNRIMENDRNDTRISRHWRCTKRLTLILLAIWGGVTLTTVFFARELATVSLFGWPLSFYLVAQGAPLSYLLICAVYAWRMRLFDQEAKDHHDAA
jgi:putative solute:sodium symporter small subunit